MPYIPTVRGRRLAQELRSLRRDVGLTGEQVAERVGWEQSKISRMENAKMRITSGEVMELLEAYNVTGDRRARLIQLAREARHKGSWPAYGEEMKEGISEYLAFESDALTYRGYQTLTIPGLLQTEDYARASFQGTVRGTAKEIERAVEARLSRQERVTSDEAPLRVHSIIEEAALHRTVDGPRTMRVQLRHLLELSELSTATIQIVPYDAGIHPADGPFVLLTFDGYPDVLYTEHLMGCQRSEHPKQTARATAIFERLRTAALSEAESATLIERMAERLASAQGSAFADS